MIAGNLQSAVQLTTQGRGLHATSVVCVARIAVVDGVPSAVTTVIPIVADGPAALLLERRYTRGDRVWLLGHLEARGGHLLVVVDQDLGATPGIHPDARTGTA
jgi:hypothetical protein